MDFTPGTQKTSPKKETQEILSGNKKRTFLKRGSSQKYDPLQAAKRNDSKQYRYYADNFEGRQPKMPVPGEAEGPIEVKRTVAAPEIIKTASKIQNDAHPTFEDVKKSAQHK